MFKLFSIIVPLDIALLDENRNSRKHYGIRTKQKNKAGLDTRNCWLAAGRPTTKPDHWPVTVDVIYRRSNLFDDGNIWGALKRPIDALFKAGATPDDDRRFFKTGEIHPVIAKCYQGDPEIEFVIYSEVDIPIKFTGRVSVEYADYVIQSRRKEKNAITNRK